MSVLDLDSLLADLTPEAPCGENLEYDPAFVELEKLMEGKPEVQYGDTVESAEPPDWKQTRRIALDLAGRTRDLRVAFHLCRTLLHTDGWVGFADGLQLLKGYVTRHWGPVHPQLDPDDDNDPTMRVNVLASLCDGATLLRELRDAPLVSSRVHGRFSLRDIEMALDEVPPPKDGAKPSTATIDGAFMDVDLAELQATTTAVQQSSAAVAEIENELTRQVGASRAADFSSLTRLLSRAQALVGERLSRRGGGPAAEVETDAAVETADGGRVAGAPVQRIAGEIASREDVVRTIDKICSYYERAEPSSPVPLLLQRAKRLVSMDFMDILRDLAPEGLPPVEMIRGKVEGDGESS